MNIFKSFWLLQTVSGTDSPGVSAKEKQLRFLILGDKLGILGY